MTERTMRRLLHCVGVAALLTLLPSLAGAQNKTNTIDTGVTVWRANDELTNTDLQYLALKDCDSEVNYRFSVRYGRSVPVFEAWLGNESMNCADKASRAPTITGQTNTACKKLKVNTSNVPEPVVTVQGVDLLTLTGTTTPSTESDNQDGGVDDSGVSDAGSTTTTAGSCDRVNGQVYTVYLLALPSETTTSSQPDLLPGTTALKAGFAVYTIPPNPPSNVQPKDGEATLKVSFDRVDATSTTTKYQAFFDLNGCESNTLREFDGEAPPNGTPRIERSRQDVSNELGLDRSVVSTVPLDTGVLAGVVTVDIAGNLSRLSEPLVCVRRVETNTPVDQCENDPACRGQFESCSASPGVGGSALALSALVLAIAALVRRRRRSA